MHTGLKLENLFSIEIIQAVDVNGKTNLLAESQVTKKSQYSKYM